VEMKRGARNEAPICPSHPGIADVARGQATLDTLRAAEHEHCLLCGPNNTLGLGLHFKLQDDGSVAATFACHEAFQSYPDTLHGGVISALLDAAMTNALFSVGVVGVTAELKVRYHARVVLNEDAVVSGVIERRRSPLFYMRSELVQGERFVARGSATFALKDCL
jgi:uncharacterized protein (TIGR00369 family)